MAALAVRNFLRMRGRSDMDACRSREDTSLCWRVLRRRGEESHLDWARWWAILPVAIRPSERPGARHNFEVLATLHARCTQLESL